MSLEEKSALKATDGATPLQPLLKAKLHCTPPLLAHLKCPLSIIWSSEVAAFQKTTSYSFSSVPFYEYLQIHVRSPVPLSTPAPHTACLNHLIFGGDLLTTFVSLLTALALPPFFFLTCGVSG